MNEMPIQPTHNIIPLGNNINDARLLTSFRIDTIIKEISSIELRGACFGKLRGVWMLLVIT